MGNSTIDTDVAIIGGGGAFKPGQTALDFLFNLGPFAAEYFHKAGHVEPERAAA